MYNYSTSPISNFRRVGVGFFTMLLLGILPSHSAMRCVVLLRCLTHGFTERFASDTNSSQQASSLVCSLVCSLGSFHINVSGCLRRLGEHRAKDFFSRRRPGKPDHTEDCQPPKDQSDRFPRHERRFGTERAV